MKPALKDIPRIFLRGAGLIGMIFIMTNWITHYSVHQFARMHPTTVIPSMIMIGSMLLIGAAAVVYHLILSVLQLLNMGKYPSPSVVDLLKTGLPRHLIDLYRRRLSLRQRKIVSLATWTAFIFLVVDLLAVEEVFVNKETYFIDTNLTHSSRQKQYDAAGADEPVRYFLFMTEDNNARKYYRDLYTLAKELKAAGAKVVVADAASVERQTENYRAGFRDIYPAINKIDSLGIVVWARRMPPWRSLYYSRDERFRFDTPAIVHAYPVYSARMVVSMKAFYPVFEPVVRWQPFIAGRQFTFSEYYMDVSLQVARKYFDVPDTTVLTTDGGEVRVGDLAIPVSSSGTAFAENVSPNFYRSPVSASRGIVVVGEADGIPDSLRYDPQVEGIQFFTSSYPNPAVAGLSGYRSFFAGKVVVINWMNANTVSDYFANVPQANVISSVLRKTLYAKYEWLTFLLTLVCSIAIATVSSFARLEWVACASVVFILGTIAASVWFFFSFRILFDPLYPITAALISCIIFSLVKITRDTSRTP